MTPSKEAIEAALGQVTVYGSREKEDMLDALNAFIAIDVAPLELCYSLLQKERDCDIQTIKDLEQRIAELEWQLQSSERANVGMQDIIVKQEKCIAELEAERDKLAKRIEREGKFVRKIGKKNQELTAENQRLKAVLKNLYDACILADNHEELSEYVDGSLLDAAKAQLEGK